MNIDELTDPGPQDPRFFAELSDRIINIGLERDCATRIRDISPIHCEESANRYASYITEGCVREFVKEAGTLVAQKVAPAGTQGRPK